MGKTLMFVYNYLRTDARVQRAADAISDLDELDLVALNDEYRNDKFNIRRIDIDTNISIVRYLLFVFGVVKYSIRKKYDCVYAHDIYSALPACVLKIFRVGKKYVYDAHELIFPQEGMKFSKRDYFFYFFEKAYIRRADIIISAQIKRGEIMRDRYSLKETPTIIQNISKLKHSDKNETLPESISQQLDRFFEKSGKTIVYAGGINEDRNIGALINASQELGDKCKVLIIGDGNETQKLKKYTEINMVTNCLFIGKVPYRNLAEILERCDIGFISYPMSDINNIYCASNKIFEYASVFLPIVATYNKTISDDVYKWRIGECSDNLKECIEKVIEKIDFYKENILIFNESNKWEDEADKLRSAIRSTRVPHEEL